MAANVYIAIDQLKDHFKASDKKLDKLIKDRDPEAIFSYLLAYPKLIVAISQNKANEDLIQTLKYYLKQSIYEDLKTDYHLKASFLFQFSNFSNSDLIYLLEAHIWLKKHIPYERELLRTRVVFEYLKHYLSAQNNDKFNQELKALFSILDNYSLNPRFRYQKLLLQLMTLLNQNPLFKELLWNLMTQIEKTKNWDSFTKFRNNQTLWKAMRFCGCQNKLSQLSSSIQEDFLQQYPVESWASETNVQELINQAQSGIAKTKIDDNDELIEQLSASIDDYFKDYLRVNEDKDSLSFDDFREVLEKPCASFLVIEALIKRYENQKSGDDLKNLQQLVDIGLNKLFYSNEKRIKDIQQDFYREIDSIQKNADAVIAVAKFLVKHRIPIVKPGPRQDFLKLLQASSTSNLNHLVMLNEALIKFSIKDGDVCLRHFSELYNSTDFNLANCHKQLLVPLFLNRQLAHLIHPRSDLQKLIKNLYRTQVFYLQKKLANFALKIAPDKSNETQKLLYDLVEFRACLTLFQIQFPSQCHNFLIKEILLLTELHEKMDLESVEMNLARLVAKPEMQQLIEHLSVFEQDIGFNNSILESLGELNSEYLKQLKSDELEQRRTLADFALISDEPLQSKDLRLAIQYRRNTQRELIDKIQNLPCISKTLQDLKKRDFVSLAKSYLEKNKVYFTGEAKKLLEILDNPKIENDTKIAHIQHSFLFIDQDALNLSPDLLSIQNLNSHISQDIDELLGILDQKNIFPDEKKRLLIKILAKPDNKDLLDKLMENNKDNHVLLEAKYLVNSVKKNVYQTQAQIIAYLQQTLSEAVKDPTCSEEQKQALETLQLFFEPEKLENRIHQLPNFIEKNKDTLSCLQPEKDQYSIFSLLIWFICLSWLCTDTSLQTVYFDKINQDLENLNHLITAQDEFQPRN